MRNLSGLLLAFALLCLPRAGWALQPDRAFHDYLHGNWSTQDGLPQVSIAALVQDQKGYLWIGTQGLARFDGVRFEVYSPENYPGLPGNNVSALYVSRNGTLWVGTTQGVATFDGIQFTAIPAVNIASGSTLEAKAFAEDAMGQIWVATTQGLFRVRGKQLELIPGSPKPVRGLLADSGGLWVGTDGAVYRVVGGQWKHEALTDAPAASVNRLVYAQGRLWAATTVGLYVREAFTWIPFDPQSPLAQKPIDLLYADRDGNLWAGGDVGLARIRDRRLIEFIRPTDSGGIIGLRTATEDREGNLWLGSLWAGLTRLSDSWARRYTPPGGLDNRIIWSLSLDPDRRRLWVGRNDGVSIFEDGKFKPFVSAAAFPHPQAYNILAERDRLWIGTRRGVAIIDHIGPQAGRVQKPAWLAPLATAQIQGFIRTNDGDLWIPSSEGLYRLQGEKLRRYAQEEGLQDPRLRQFLRLRDGRVLAATQSGLFEMKGERFVPMGVEQGLPAGLDLTALLELKNGGIVAGAYDDFSYYFDGSRWHLLSAEQGLPSNVPFTIMEHAGYVWISGIHGIMRVPSTDLAEFASGQRKQVRGEMLIKAEGNAKTGQPGICCNGAGNSKGLVWGNTLWVPTREGILTLATDTIVYNAVRPHAVIERIQSGNQWQAASAVRNQSLPENARDLSFEFTVLSLQDPTRVGIEYRLVGYDRDWRIGDPTRRTVQYTNLPPGAYTFEVRGTNNNGLPGEETAQLPFSIKPYFYETWMFKALLAFLALAGLFGLYRFQRHRYQQRQLELEELVNQRTSALKAANRKLEEASHTDPLTGLRNRRYMAEQIPTDLAYYHRRQGMDSDSDVLLFVMVDIDHFKSINDNYGHKAGDMVLQQFARVMEGLVRTGDYVVRWGGEEFLVVFRPMPTRNLTAIGERLRNAVVSEEFDIEAESPLKITCSIGISEYPLFSDDRMLAGWEMMVELADHALYYVKTHGRDGWAAFRPTESTNIGTLMQDLRESPEKMLSQNKLQLMGTKAKSASDAA